MPITLNGQPFVFNFNPPNGGNPTSRNPEETKVEFAMSGEVVVLTSVIQALVHDGWGTDGAGIVPPLNEAIGHLKITVLMSECDRDGARDDPKWGLCYTAILRDMERNNAPYRRRLRFWVDPGTHLAQKAEIEK